MLTPMVFMASSVTQDYGNKMIAKDRDFSYSCETSSRAPASKDQEDLSVKLKEKELENNMLQFRLLETEKELETARKAAADLALQIEVAKSQPKAAISEDQSKRIAELTAELKKTQDDLDSRSAKILELEDKLVESKKDMESLAHKVSQSEAGKEALQKIISQKDAEMAKKDLEMAALRKDIDLLKKERASSSAQAAAISSARAENNVAILNQHLTAVNLDIKVDLDKFLLEKEAEVKKLRSQVAKNMADAIALQQKVISYQRLVMELKKKIAELESIIKSKEEEVIARDEQIKKIEEEKAAAAKAVEEKVAEESRRLEAVLSEERCKHEDSVALLKKEIETLIKDKKDIAAKLEKLDEPKEEEAGAGMDQSSALQLLASINQQMQLSNSMFQQQMQQMVMMNGSGSMMGMGMGLGMNTNEMNNFLMMSMMQKWNLDYMQYGAFQNNSHPSMLGDLAVYRNSNEQFWNYNPYVEQMYQSNQPLANPYSSMQMGPSMMTRTPAQGGMFSF